MMHDPLERDAGLETALREVAADPARVPVDWGALQGRIARDAAPELARRRARRRPTRLAIPAALAASIALLVLVSHDADRSDGSARRDAGAAFTAVSATVDELLDADLSDRQFRALLFGAGEVDDLLLIAAEERESSVTVR